MNNSALQDVYKENTFTNATLGFKLKQKPQGRARTASTSTIINSLKTTRKLSIQETKYNFVKYLKLFIFILLNCLSCYKILNLNFKYFMLEFLKNAVQRTLIKQLGKNISISHSFVGIVIPTIIVVFFASLYCSLQFCCSARGAFWGRLFWEGLPTPVVLSFAP